MEKKKVNDAEIVELGYRGYFILVSIFLLAACGVIALLMNHLKNDNLEIRELKTRLEQVDDKNCPSNSVPVYLTQEDLVEKLFGEKLSKADTIEQFKIEDVYIEDINQFIGSGVYAKNYTGVDKNSVFAVVTYSVKPIGSYGRSIWNNNNGTFEDDWVKNKKSYIHVKKTDKGYIIDGDGYGTKW